MANYRQFHVSAWKDEWFLELEPNEKLLFIYTFTNENASLSGLYKIAVKVIAFETGLPLDFVRTTLAKFERAGKVFYRDGIMWVVNMRRYNRGGDTVNKNIQNDVELIQDCELKRMYIQYHASQQRREFNPPPPEVPEERDEPEVMIPEEGAQATPDTLQVGYEYPNASLSLKCNEMNVINDCASAQNLPKPPDDDFFGDSPEGKRRRSTVEAMARGQKVDVSLVEVIEKEFRIMPNWQTKTARAFMGWLKERPPGETVAQFSRWWKSTDWRGKQGQPPTLTLIQELWPQAFTSDQSPIVKDGGGMYV